MRIRLALIYDFQPLAGRPAGQLLNLLDQTDYIRLLPHHHLKHR